MPTYVYKFVDSGETFEVQQAFTDDVLTHAMHPVSGEERQVKKVFTPVGVTFKGGGFYKTDSRGGRSKTSSSSSSSDSSSDSSSSSKPDSASTTTKSDSGSSTSTAAAAPAATSTD